jgi:N-acetylmuramoyl-L-alanine amidase
MKFYISPSSQEANIYTTGTTEETIMNLITDALCDRLSKYPSIQFMRNRKNNTYAGHIMESNTYKPDIHLAIHSNSSNGLARGCEVFCFDPNSATAISTKFAKILYNKISAMTPTADRGVKAGAMAEIRTTQAPAVLIEIAFHDNKEDAAWIITNIAEIAQAILMSILEIANVPFVPDLDDYTAMKGALKQIKNIVSPF